jgi:micrococcal nuclease
MPRLQSKPVALLLMILGLGGTMASLWTFLANPPQQASPLAAQPDKVSCRVLRVYDGDTFACDLNENGQVDPPHERIRLLGIDTPEMHYSKSNKTGLDEPFAAEASQYAEQHLREGVVYLNFDLEQTDRYGRTLAHVYLAPDATETLNEALLREGLARVLFIPPNVQHRPQYRQAEREAKNQGRGLWSLKRQDQLGGGNHKHQSQESP